MATLQSYGNPHFFHDSLALLAYITALSVFALVVHLLLVSATFQTIKSRVLGIEPPSEFGHHENSSDPASTSLQDHVNQHGGRVTFAYKICRVLGCLMLLSLSIYTLISFTSQSHDPGTLSTSWRVTSFMKNQIADSVLLQWSMCTTYLYTCLLSSASVITKPRWSKVISKHLTILLLVIFCVYCYRDLLPLATYTRSPADLSEGRVLWAKITIVTFLGIVIPLLTPRQYIPVDPENPMTVPNAEQTAPLLSLIIYTFLDPVVFLAYRIPHLSHSQLPPLSDYDYAHVLKARSFPHLDPFSGGKRQHIFWALMHTFRREYIIMSIMVFLQVAATFATPIGIRELLHYVETRGKDATIRPWFWILWLFVGPALGSMAWQWYIYTATRTLVRTECILSQLIFEHSLRIRVKAETEPAVPSISLEHSRSTTPDVDSASCTPSSIDDSIATSSHQREVTGTTEVDTLNSSDDTLHSSSSSTKSTKQKKERGRLRSQPGSTEQREEPVGNSSADNLVGKINNLITTDLANIVDSRDFLLVLIYIPLQITLCIIFLYIVLGWSAFVGLAAILLMFPMPGYVAKRIQHVQVARLKATDSRVQHVTETMNVLRMIKLFGWESKTSKKIGDKRDQELVWVWRRQILDLVNGNLNFLIPIVTMIATYTTYVFMRQELNASTVFSSMTVFDMLRDQLHMVFFYINQVVSGKVSIDRVNDFLHNTELLDAFTENYSADRNDQLSDHIGFRNATFVWSSDVQGNLTPSKRKFSLQIDGELYFQRGQINLILGPTGSGKTSLLMALLGEMHFQPSGPDSWYSLPRNGGVAYAAQESWIQNETIRDNIVFGAPFDEIRYKKVLYQCSLERDLELFEAGDQTEVGEKGLTLSGGQKARVTLARAVYSLADILLLDDVLAALDVHTAKWIVDKCFSGDLIKGRTVLLVTHNIAMTRPIAGFMVSIAADGTILSQGPISETLSNNESLLDEIRDEERMIAEVNAPPKASESTSDGKLIAIEEIEEGHVSWQALKLYFQGLGGNHSALFFLSVVGGLLLTDLCTVMQTWYLGYWASQYEEHVPSEVPVFYYLSVYSFLLFSAVTMYCSSFVVYIYGAIRASRRVHEKLVESILGTTLRWLDVTPTSRVITRCTQDIRAVDGPISNGLWWLSEMTVSMLVKFAAVVLLTPVFLLPGILVAIMGGWCGQIYIRAQLSVKREMSNAKAPVLGHLGAAIAGLTSIRAYGAQARFTEESLRRINQYTRAARTFYNLNRWISIRIDAIGALFATSLAAYLVYFQNQKASNTGFSLNMAVGFSGMILWWVRVLNEFELQGMYLERIQGYIRIEQEPKPTSMGIPPARWPTSGDIRVEGLTAKYSSDGPKVLHNISFHIASGQRVGVVGRTGSGKSSLTLSLLRCILTEGDVYYDGRNTAGVNLDILRSNITIIPQIPELLSGTLRQNLDPFDQYDDAMLNDALHAAGLFSLQNETEQGKITLDTAIASGGYNLSVGQRQILALARAIVRGSKLLILDEATSAIDYKTDSVIQTSLRRELPKDVTLITIAHRLQTIMDADKIMVLDAGHIVEFDSPKVLLKLPQGKLRALVDESGDRDTLYAIAGLGDIE